MELDSLLLKKYNISGPRYTSYPTALEFNEDFDDSKYLMALSSIDNQTLSLYFHIPFCSNICYYCACNKVITKDLTRSESYINYLITEAKLIASNLKTKQVGQVHFGGGTPTFLTEQQLTRLVKEINTIFDLKADAEISIEIDPRTIDQPGLKNLSAIGFNRISIGVQDFNKKVQVAVNREHSFDDVKIIFDQARKINFQSINMDLIYGLPHQSEESFAETIEKVIDLKPNRIALYNYAHLPHRFKPQRRINSYDLPTVEEKLAIFKSTMKLLVNAGYIYIGMDHFALPDDGLSIAQQKGKLHRNFQGYTTHKDYQLLGLGVSSISKVNGCYSQNQTNLEDYYQMLDKEQLPVWRGYELNQDDELRRNVIMSLICNFKLEFSKIESEHKIQFLDYFTMELEQLTSFVEDELVKVSTTGIEVTDNGRYFIRNICMVFDRYLQELSLLQQYSKVI